MTGGERTYNVLFLCTGNSARSILAERILEEVGGGRFRGFSAGSHPNGRVNPLAMEYLAQHRLPVAGLRSKSWDEFERPGAPPLDFVITVCDDAAGETCPVWPGKPVVAHWGIPDPAAVDGPDDVKRKAFADAARTLRHRISLFVSLPLAKLDALTLERRTMDIGRTHPG